MKRGHFNAKAAKRLRKTLREAAIRNKPEGFVEVAYVEIVEKRYILSKDKDGNPDKTFDVTRRVLDPNCFRGMYKTAKKLMLRR